VKPDFYFVSPGCQRIKVSLDAWYASNWTLWYEIELESNLELQVEFRLDIRVLNQAPISFVQNVIRQSKVIVDKEPNKRSDFENQVLKKYFDFAHFRRRSFGRF